MVLKKLAAAVGGILALAGSACDDIPIQTVVHFRMGDVFSFFQYAANKGPVWVDLRGNPFGGSESAIAGVVTDSLGKGITGLAGVRLTPDYDAAGDPKQRIVLLLGVAESQNFDAVCNGNIPSRFGGLGTDGELRSLAVFCSDSQVRAAVGALARGIESPQDKTFAKMLSLSMIQMFREDPA